MNTNEMDINFEAATIGLQPVVVQVKAVEDVLSLSILLKNIGLTINADCAPTQLEAELERWGLVLPRLNGDGPHQLGPISLLELWYAAPLPLPGQLGPIIAEGLALGRPTRGHRLERREVTALEANIESCEQLFWRFNPDGFNSEESLSRSMSVGDLLIFRSANGIEDWFYCRSTGWLHHRRIQ
jgi:hypothetical protein